MDSRRVSGETNTDSGAPYDEVNPDIFDDEYAEDYAISTPGPTRGAAASDAAFFSPFGDDAAIGSGDGDDTDTRSPSPRLADLQPRNSILKAARRSLRDGMSNVSRNGLSS